MMRVLIALTLFVAACSHDTSRENPVDPSLTPPVQVTAALNDTAGTVQLAWDRYVGSEPFGQYVVLRSAVGVTAVDTLATVPVVEQTSLTDSTLAPGTAYEYRVSVISQGGFEATSQSQRVDGFQVRSVELLAAAPEQDAGHITLRWAHFRDPGFTEYRLFRRPVGSDADSMLTTRSSVADTTFVDVTAQHQVDYLYRVVVFAAGRQLTSDGVTARLDLRPVTVHAPLFESQTATAMVNWSPYTGPRFEAYRLSRSVEGQTPVELTRIESSTDTTFADTRLHGATEYEYRVEVLTSTGERIASEAVSGGFHEPVAGWSVPMQEGDAVRLVPEADGVTAVVAGPDRVTLLRYADDGALIDTTLLWDSHGLRMAPQTVTYAPGENGEHILGLVTVVDATPSVHLLRLSQDGRPNFDRSQRLELDMDRRGAPLAESPALVLQSIDGADDTVHVSHVSLATDEGAWLEDFADGVSDWAYSDETLGFPCSTCPFLGSLEPVAAGAIHPIVGSTHTTARWLGPSVTAPFRYETVVRLGSPSDVKLLVLGEPTVTHVRMGVVLSLDEEPGFRVTRRRTGALSAGGGNREVESGFVPVPEFPYRLRMEVGANDEILIGEAGQPDFWSQPLEDTPEVTSLGTVIVGGQPRWVLTAGPESFGVGEGFSVNTSGVAISEQRYYAEGRQLAVCFAENHQVVLAPARVNFLGSLTLPGLTDGVGLSKGIGQGDGQMVFPISVDISPDGRTYVLDAGNARIQVFDSQGEYITQWGGQGDEPGQFDFFGGGLTTAGVLGSIAVDDDGFVYVADVGNRRIQKFAP